MKITLHSKSPTPLLTWFLNLIQLPFTKGIGNIELQASQRVLWDMRQLVNGRIDSIMRKHGYAVAKLDDFSHISDISERFNKLTQARLPIVEAAIAKDGLVVSKLTAEILSDFPGLRFFRHCPFGGLSVLAEDEAFGVKSLHHEVRRNVKVMAGKGFNFSSNFGGDWRDRDITAESFSDDGKEGRFAHYKNILEQLVNGITDPDEKLEFVERVFNDAMRKSLNKAKK